MSGVRYIGIALIVCVQLVCAMELVPDPVLQKLIASASSVSSGIATIIKEHAQRNNMPIIPAHIGSLFQLNQDNINQMFLTHVKDNELRPLLLTMGADINARRKGHSSNCLWNIDDPRLLTELIKKGADVNAQDEFGETALTWLCSYCHLPCPISKNFSNVINAVGILISSGDPQYCYGRNKEKLLHSMLLNPFPGTEETILKIVELFSAHGKDLDEINFSGRTLLMVAIERNMKSLVEFFLKKGVDSNNVNRADNYGYYPLHIALPEHQLSKKDTINPEIIALLLQYGADPNQCYPHSKKIPLDVAIQRGSTEIIKTLLEYGSEYEIF